MENTYFIHSNIYHCKVKIDGKLYFFNEVFEKLKDKRRIYLKNSRKLKSIAPTIDDFYKNFKTLNSSKSDLEDFYFKRKKKDDATAWKSRQRLLRKQGKLTDDQIDKLNDLGMVWNPKEDEWEQMFELYRINPLIDISKRLIGNSHVTEKKFMNFIKLENWEKTQKNLYSSNKLSDENLRRLKSIDFSFTNQDDQKLELGELVKIIFNLKDLKSFFDLPGSTKTKFISYFNLRKEDNLEGVIRISESQINKKRLVNKDELKQTFEIKKNEELINKALNEASMIPFDYHKKTIDKISFYEPSEEERKKYGFSNIQELVYNRFSNRRNELLMYLSNDYYSKKYKLWVNYEYDSDTKRYACESILTILDLYLLKTGYMNSNKNFKSISYLIKLYKNLKSKNDLERILAVIKRHNILTLIYKQRVEKLLIKLK